MTAKPYTLIKDFSLMAKKMRGHFDAVYADPRVSLENRFVWDYWNLPEQYRLHRTLARSFFPKNIYEQFLNELLRFGQEELGCHSVSEPWLSFYIDGCEQNLHTDSPHGPWAYVYSLTPTKTKFSGGDTLILKPEILNYAANENKMTKSYTRGLENNDLCYKVPPKFNQLLIFDPSIPHGVSTVRGVYDQSDARLVIHGWFVQPEAFVTGGLKEADMNKPLNVFFEHFTEEIEDFAAVSGLCTWSFQVQQGKVKNVELKTDRLRGLNSDEKKDFYNIVRKLLTATQFPPVSKNSQVVLPIVFGN